MLRMRNEKERNSNNRTADFVEGDVEVCCAVEVGELGELE
jgi:hypothetical protein